jgi:hypothetical protein
VVKAGLQRDRIDLSEDRIHVFIVAIPTCDATVAALQSDDARLPSFERLYSHQSRRRVSWS